MERIKKAILLVFSFIFALFLCFIFSDLVYHFQTGEWYYKKGSLCKKISKAYTKSMEYELGRYPSKTVKDLSINIGLDKIQDWTKREVGQNVGLVCFEKEITLNFLDFKAVNRGEYSLSFSVGLNEEFDSSCYVSLMVNKNEEWLSHKQIFPKDVLTAVLPSRPRCLRSPKVLLRVYCFKDSMPKLLRPALVLTPIYAKYEKSNYHESFSFKKGNKIRILAIGGSTTYGTSNEQNTTWPSILQQKLNVLYPNKFEVLNLGIWGGVLEILLKAMI